MELRHYEITILLDPNLTEEEVQEQMEEHNAIFRKAQAQVLHQAAPDLKKLAYPIQKHTHAFYIFTEFTGPTTIIAQLERLHQRNEKVLRSLTLHLDKHAITFNEQERQKQSRS